MGSVFTKHEFRRKHLSSAEKQLLLKIRRETDKLNMDNISRTQAYLHFYLKHPEILWSFLASVVSRNGGYNMCDLEGEWLPKIIKPSDRKSLFLTYERANWTIFRDAFPQLLLYHYSTKIGRPMFHLLAEFNISIFMENEWNVFWQSNNQKRLMTALIVNEQNVIQQTVVELKRLQKKVFNTVLFLFQDVYHASAVLLPTMKGELYGASTAGFKSVHKRIDLGKRIADILFDPQLYPQFTEFALETEHTGSRYDYEQYFFPKPQRDTPFLRCAFPLIHHHYRRQADWYDKRKFHPRWMSEEVDHKHPTHLTAWFLHKQRQMKILSSVVGWIRK